MTNTIFPGIARSLNIPAPLSGGWMYALLAQLRRTGGASIGVAAVGNVPSLLRVEIDEITYYVLPKGGRLRKRRIDWAPIIRDFRPDLVHLHGTEFPHGAELMAQHPDLPYLISIQGLVSIAHRYFLAGMSTSDVLRHITIRDVVRRDTLFQAKLSFAQRGVSEQAAMKKAKGLMGRTEWDRLHSQAIAPLVPYFACNEILLDDFYERGQWSVDRCTKHSIFVSQAAYPLKGFHQLLRAAARLVRVFPDLLIKVAGPHQGATESRFARLRRSGYASYINSLIAELNLADKIQFLGPLSAGQMADAYLDAHVFVMPSSIENSPNSIGEAQLLGVPVVAACVGGIPSMVTDRETALLYRFEEFEVLGELVAAVFTDEDLAIRLSTAGTQEAQRRHHRSTNVSKLLTVYRSLAVDPRLASPR